MQIYQLYEHSGDCDDYHDSVIGTYINEDLAKTEMNRLEEIEKAKQDKITKCRNCPMWDDDFKTVKKYCDNYKPYSDEPDNCANYDYNWEEKTYEIKIETVICE